MLATVGTSAVPNRAKFSVIQSFEIYLHVSFVMPPLPPLPPLSPLSPLNLCSEVDRPCYSLSYLLVISPYLHQLATAFPRPARHLHGGPRLRILSYLAA